METFDEQRHYQPTKQQMAHFAFGDNWQRFLSVVDENRIMEAERSLKSMLAVESLDGKTFLDIGSGSGLFSLAAARLGAKVVHSFDYDAQSVACTAALKERFLPGADNWTIEQGDVLNATYYTNLGRFDVVYSWGVLHHTGDMWHALAIVASLVGPSGRLFISIYNDQGRLSRYWNLAKRTYNALPKVARGPFMLLIMAPRELRSLLYSVATLRPMTYVRSWTEYDKRRGMSHWHDIRDWMGGYPFQVARPEEIFEFYYARGFALMKMKTWSGGSGCNEFVFLGPV